MIHTLRKAAFLIGTGAAMVWHPSPAPAQQMLQPPANQPPVTHSQPQAQPGIEVLARGPIHEAFAQPYAAEPAPGGLVPKAPPAPIAELPPNNKPDGANVQWIPGYWSWDDERQDFIWVSGLWRAVPPGREWHTGQWVQDANGYRWTHGYCDATNPAQRATTLPTPPPASLDQGASSPAPNENSVYVPGAWVYTESGYRWRPGYWAPLQDNWTWNPDQYYWSPSGYNYVPGYWDYPLADRGELFAPVAFDSAVYLTPGFTYSPSYTVAYDGWLNSLFVRPGFRSYYFGDYYGRNYLSAGFYPWFSFGYGRRYDPLWAYHNWYYPRHGYNGWYDHYRGLYDGRVRGDFARPPRTLAQQNVFANQNGVRMLTHAGDAHRHVGPAQVSANFRSTPIPGTIARTNPGVGVTRPNAGFPPVSVRPNVAAAQNNLPHIQMGSRVVRPRTWPRRIMRR